MPALACSGADSESPEGGAGESSAGTAGQGSGGANNGGGSAGQGGVAGAAMTTGGAGGGAGSGTAGSAQAGQGGAGGAAGSGGMGGAAGSGGTGGTNQQAKLERVLAFEFVDINPDTGELRGHNGGGADEALLKELATEHDFQVDITSDGTPFTAENLAKYDVIAFCSPHYATQVLSQANRAAIETFVKNGGGWVGWHYALHNQRDWPFLKTLGGGATAISHMGGEQESTYTVKAPNHPVMQGVPATFKVTDDFLKMSDDPTMTSGVTLLATAALTAPPGGDGHPAIWVTEVGQGRAFYSMVGHNAPDFKTAVAKTLMWNALRWVTH